MRAIPKSKTLASVEAVLLLAVIATGVVLRNRARESAAAPPSAVQQPGRQARPAATPPPAAAVPGASPDRIRRISLRQQRPFYARIFADLYENPQLNTLHLSDDQLDALTDCYTQLYQDRLTLEASLAQVDEVDGGGVLIEIPAYPDAGKALEQVFLSSMDEKFGGQLAGQIEALYLQRIEAQNENLGQLPQRILASADPENPGRLKIVHDMSAPDGSSRGTQVSQITESDFREYGPLAAYFPKP